MPVQQLKLSVAQRETLFRFLAGIDAEAPALGKFTADIKPFNEGDSIDALKGVFTAIVAGTKPDLETVKLLLGKKPLPPDQIDISSMTVDEFKAVYSAAQQKDILTPFLKDNGEFGKVLNKVLDSTFRNAFTDILMESAEVAVREASLELLRATFISVAKGSKKTTIEGEIKKRFRGGGQDGDVEDMPHNP